MPTPGCSTSPACQGVLAKCPRTLTFSLGLGGRESSLGREAATAQGSRLPQGSAGMDMDTGSFCLEHALRERIGVGFTKG